ncbi:hypothetical protein [EBPR siphovirus 3]|nr:hypothetical protein [EBPR siphovirus 3]
MNLADTPAAMIARLDASLARRGETIILRRLVSGTWREVTLRGRLSGHMTDDLVGTTKQTLKTFILSPTLLNAAVAAATWPPVPGTPRIKLTDELEDVDGVSRRIDSLAAKRINDVIVRYEGQILG